MFSKFRGSFCRYFSDAVHLNRTADRAFQVPTSARERNDDAIFAQLRILGNVAWIPHQTVGYVSLVEDFAPVSHRLRAEYLVYYCSQLAHIRGQLCRIGKSRIPHKISAAD